MIRKTIAILSFGVWSVVGLAQTPGGNESRIAAALAGKRVEPRFSGTPDHSVTVLSATKFSFSYDVSPNLSVYCDLPCSLGQHWYATLDLPAGTVIDAIGVNTKTTVDNAMGITLHVRDHLGGTAPLFSASFPAHDFATDLYGPLDILVPSNVDRVFVLDVEVAPGLPDRQFFGFVEIWWRRVVSDAPATPTFADVPSSHPFYQFIEALAASKVTGGCGGGNFCPDKPLTRGQMAVFLSKALGLHWPN